MLLGKALYILTNTRIDLNLKSRNRPVKYDSAQLQGIGVFCSQPYLLLASKLQLPSQKLPLPDAYNSLLLSDLHKLNLQKPPK